jgi:hypothetical protein
MISCTPVMHAALSLWSHLTVVTSGGALHSVAVSRRAKNSGRTWRGGAETMECVCDISRHGYVNRAVSVVPGEGEAAVHFGLPVSGDFVVGLQCMDEVFASSSLVYSTAKSCTTRQNVMARISCHHRPAVCLQGE